MPDNPDFDSMSPEEMMRWMESLAKRQGADAEGFTTDADLEVDEVDEADERLAGQGEYIPHGWTKEKWEAQLAKEEEEKQRKQATSAQPEPEPEPEPAAEAAGQPAMEEVDFENMSPEEAMRFMESLAKRQGATEGFTTSADMEVDEVDETDERLKDQPEYIPDGWSRERWEAQLAKEKAEREERLAAQATGDTEEPDEEEELVAADLDDIFGGDNELPPIEDEDEIGQPIATGAEIDDSEAPNFDDIFGGDNELPPVQDEATQPAEPVAAENPMDWLSGLAGEEAEDEFDLDMDALGELEGMGGDEGGDPMDWLAGLADEDTPDEMPDFSSMEGLEDLEGLAAEADEAPQADEGSLEWMESLARRQGADSEELVTGGEMELPDMDDEAAEEAPGYEPYSFESGTGTGMEQDDDEFEDEFEPPVANFDTSQLELEDPASWLDSLAAGVASRGEDEADLDEADEIAEEAAAAIGEGDEEYEEGDEELTSEVTNKLNTGEDVSPEEIQSFFEAQFRRADKRDVPDYIDTEDEEGELVRAEIPDWLAESMEQEPPIAEFEDEAEQPAKTDTAEMMIADLGLDEMEADEDEFPDWLSGDAGMEGEDISDIFADTESTEADMDVDLSFLDDVEEGESVVTEAEAQTAADLQDEIQIDAEDSWVAAFSREEDSKLEDWYEAETAKLQGQDAPAEAAEPVAEAAGQELIAAELAVETELPKGQPQAMPAWMKGEAADMTAVTEQPSIQTAAIEEADLDWLDEEAEATAAAAAAGAEEMPSWLQDQVDDSVADADDIPDWLTEEDLDVAPEEIPDWLRETMEEEEAIIAQQAEPALPEPAREAALPAPETEAAPQREAAAIQPAAKSPAPVPAAAKQVDAAATLQAARESISQDNADDALADYELLIRANLVLDEVEKDLDKLTNKHKRNPAIHRLLGDVQMRQGKLQMALDTYRRALNML